MVYFRDWLGYILLLNSFIFSQSYALLMQMPEVACVCLALTFFKKHKFHRNSLDSEQLPFPNCMKRNKYLPTHCLIQTEQ